MTEFELKDRGLGEPASAAAQHRIDQARIRDATFFLRRNVGEANLNWDDAELLTRIVMAEKSAGHQLTPEAVAKMLMKAGRSRDKAHFLADILFK